MSRQMLLTSVVILFLAVALAVVLTTFFMMLNPHPPMGSSDWGVCDISALKPDEVMSCHVADVYRRTEADKKHIHAFRYLLEDPDSLRSVQPESARNQWRSENPEYFIFRASAPRRPCLVKLKQANPDERFCPEQEAIRELPYFQEGCETRIWDTSGRLYRREGFLPESNLTVPRVK